MSSRLRRVKDAALEKALLVWLRPRVRRYGEIRWLRLDTDARTLEAEITLRGDPAPVIISEARYRIEGERQQTRIVFHSARVSREWAQNLLEDFFPEVPLKIPDFIRPLLE